MVAPASPLDRLLTPPSSLAATTLPGNQFARLLRLPGGSWVCSWSEEWRLACEMAEIAARPAPDAELVTRAARRSGKDPAVAEVIAAALRRQFAAWLALVADPDADVLAAAAEVVALPDKAARRAALDQIKASAGPLTAAALEAEVRALWHASR